MSGNDRQWVRRSLNGDRGAFDLLYHRHVPRVFHFLRRLTGDEADAEDLTQETFLAAYVALASWRGEGGLGTWLCGIAFRQYAAARRQRRLETEPLDEASELTAIAGGPDPLAQCVRQEQFRRVEAALAALPPLPREVFVLVKVEGLSYREAAAWLSVPLGTVQSRLWRAVCMLQKALSDLVEPAGDGRSGVQAFRRSGIGAGETDEPDGSPRNMRTSTSRT
jgi:RNA polymerase sigma-70 factor (ECF subfamily)